MSTTFSSSRTLGCVFHLPILFQEYLVVFVNYLSCFKEKYLVVCLLVTFYTLKDKHLVDFWLPILLKMTLICVLPVLSFSIVSGKKCHCNVFNKSLVAVISHLLKMLTNYKSNHHDVGSIKYIVPKKLMSFWINMPQAQSCWLFLIW